MDFEDILEEVGDFGLFQKRLIVCYVIVSATLLPLYCMTTIFMVSSPTHWCKVNQLLNFSYDLQKQLISPQRVENGVTKYDSCNMFDIDYHYLSKVANISIYKSDKNITHELSVKPCDNGWTFDNSYYDETAVTALNLVCDRSHYISLILSVGSIGTIIGTPIFGWLSDKIGRKKTFQITLFVSIIQSLSPTIFRDLNSFLIFRTITGLLLPSFYQLPYIVLVETVGPRYRTRINSIACLSWVAGLCVLSFLAFITRDWILMHIISSSTVIIFFFYWNLLPESPRWLLSNEKYSEAVILLEKMAKTNGKPKPDNLEQKLKSVGKSLNSKESEQVHNAIWVFLKNPGLRSNFMIITLNWMACAAIYYGIHLNLYNLSGNEFFNFFLMSIIEAPGYLLGWYCIETRFGRRWSFSLFLVLCGLSLCSPAIIPNELWWLTNGMTFLGKFCGTISFMVIYQQAAEIYPTSIRNQGMGVGSMASSIVGIAMPYLTFSVSHVWIPLTILGVISIIIGVFSTLLPETLNVNLPQTIEEGNSFGKNQKYFSWAHTTFITKIDNNLSVRHVMQMKAIETLDQNY